MDGHGWVFDDFFQFATGHKPYPYQRQLAEGERFPAYMRVPTGAGKTAAVLLAWYWRRFLHPCPQVRSGTPRRLVYCLPMRVLVEQTVENARAMLAKLADSPATPGAIGVHVLMGGEVADEWALDPASPAVLVGTQDMLLSRALNRGYGMNRFGWPAAFGLVNNDCLWVLDEVQLMGVGLATTTQLAGLRQKLGTFGPTQCLWMSATMDSHWLRTVDHGAPDADESLGLTDDDLAGDLRIRLGANKSIVPCPVSLSRFSKTPELAAALAREIKAAHCPATLTLVILNTVERARGVYQALHALLAGKPDAPEILLAHSRFRPAERNLLNHRLRAPVPPESPGRIVVSTQVVEAGVDISARTLFTELASWTSLVQRFGRCNRYGEHTSAEVRWLDVPDDRAAPYRPEDLTTARALLGTVFSAAPLDIPPVDLTREPDHVIRRKDLVELFDTTPDLSGNDVDVSRFIREDNDLDLHLLWRDFTGHPPDDIPAPDPSEICPAPLPEVRDRLQTGLAAWRWDHLESRWAPVRPGQLRPGQTLVLRAAEGGYGPETGWDKNGKHPVPPVAVPLTARAEGVGDDHQAFRGYWLALADHANDLAQEVSAILAALSGLNLPGEVCRGLEVAARWHDAGKAHPVFQETLLGGLPPEERTLRGGTVWAKSATRGRRHSRRHFRHELASALAYLQAGDPDPLAAYLIASHHGRVRLSIRSLPGEQLAALGIRQEDRLPGVDLGGGISLPATVLDLGPMELGRAANGRPSWTEMALSLRDRADLGPFRIAFLEALLRAADVTASMKREGE